MKSCSQSNLVLGLGALMVVPLISHAADTGSFTNSLTLWTAAAIGLLTSGAVLYSAYKIGGGALQLVYQYFGIGMLFVVLATVSVALPQWADPEVVARTHDLLFVIGFGVMAYGAQHLLRVVGLK